MRICICGGGSLGHAIAGWTSARGFADVDIYTRHPEKWTHELSVFTPEGNVLKGEIDRISGDPVVLAMADVVLLCLPGFLIGPTLEAIMPHLKPETYVGAVFSSTGFFFEAQRVLAPSQPLWGFQRVPFIARVREYGRSVDLLGYKNELKVAVENVPSEEKAKFAAWLALWFNCPVGLLANHYEASLSNSNPLLHPARLFSLFGSGNEVYDRPVLFYEEWNDEASELLIAMDREFFGLLDKLPVSRGFLPTILEYYESRDAASLTAKISSIKAFKGIYSPMVQGSDGLWHPDMESRYFKEDFPYGLRFIHDLAMEYNVKTPTIDRIYSWGMSFIER